MTDPLALIPLAPSELAAAAAPKHAPPPITSPPSPSDAPGVSSRGRRYKLPDRFAERFHFSADAPSPPNPDLPADPISLDEALASEQSEDWIKAINSEIVSLFEKGTFDIVKTPDHHKPIGSKWVFKRKYDAYGFLTKYKARLVAKGFLQRYGVDYSEVFSPVSKMTSLRLLLSLVAARDLELKQLDVSTAFLNGTLDEEVYVQIPPGLNSRYPNMCFRLRKAIYGLKQAPRVWWLKLSSTLIENGFKPSFADPCLLYRQGKHGFVLMLVYVDDVLAAGHPSDVSDALSVITSTYDCSEIEDARSFLGMAITRDRRAGTLTLSQPNYIAEIVKKHNFDAEQKYTKSTPIPDLKADFNAGELLPLDNPYASLIGSLLYLANCTRPDISFAISTLARHMKSPCVKHWGLAKDLLRYVLATRDLSLTFHRSPPHSEPLSLIGYSDSDFGNNCLPTSTELITRRSVTGFIFLSNGTPISWSSKKQVTVARSSDEAEYQALATSTSQALWLRKLLAEINPPARKLLMFCDNQAALTHVRNPGSINKSKHIDITYQFVLDRQTRGDIEFDYIHTSKNLADIFTKALPRDAFQSLRYKIFGAPSQTNVGAHSRRF